MEAGPIDAGAPASPTLAALAAQAVRARPRTHAAVLAIGHYAFWTRRLHQPVQDDGIVRARTRDGWELALGTRRPRAEERLPPVLLVHGLSANRWTLDAGVERVSLAAHLSRQGFRTFALDLRGHGDSRRRPPGAPDWSFDHYVEEDVPAALDAIRRETGEERVLWVGHSLGAVTGLVACQLHPGRIAGVVAIAGPMAFDTRGRVARYVRRGAVVDGRFNRTLARMVAPWAGLAYPPAAEIAIEFLDPGGGEDAGELEVLGRRDRAEEGGPLGVHGDGRRHRRQRRRRRTVRHRGQDRHRTGDRHQAR